MSSVSARRRAAIASSALRPASDYNPGWDSLTARSHGDLALGSMHAHSGIGLLSSLPTTPSKVLPSSARRGGPGGCRRTGLRTGPRRHGPGLVTARTHGSILGIDHLIPINGGGDHRSPTCGPRAPAAIGAGADARLAWKRRSSGDSRRPVTGGAFGWEPLPRAETLAPSAGAGSRRRRWPTRRESRSPVPGRGC